MSLTRKDLRKKKWYGGDRHSDGAWLFADEVTLADLVEILTNEHGAWGREAHVMTRHGKLGLEVTEPGRYLIVPIPGGTTDE
jgi:hypothetical protein